MTRQPIVSRSILESVPASSPDGSSRRLRGWERLSARYPDVAAAYDALREATLRGPLEGRLVALVKLAVSVGAGAERTVHAHTRKALQQGVRPDELRHVALVALPTIGLPAALEALKQIDQSIAEVIGDTGSVAAQPRNRVTDAIDIGGRRGRRRRATAG